MPLGPFDVLQGATTRIIFQMGYTLPATPPLVASVTQPRTVVFSGSADPTQTIVLTVTAPGGPFIFTLPCGYWPLNQIAGELASIVSFTPTGKGSETASSNGASVTVGDSAVTAISVAVTQSPVADLTNCTATMVIRRSYGSLPILTLTTPEADPGGLAIDTLAGTITATIAAAQTAAFPVPLNVAAATNQYSTTSTSIVPSVVLPFYVKLTYPSGDVKILDAPTDTPFELTVYAP